MPVPFDYQADWGRMARIIVHQALATEPGERVLIHADPTYFPALTEAVRIEVNRAGAVELATHCLHPPALERVRRQLRRREDPTLRALEDRALTELFALADIYIWLPTSWAWNVGQSEAILASWPGRAIHFHWVMDQPDPTVFRRLSEMYEAALLVDREALTGRQRRVIEALQDTRVEITDPRGTSLRLTIRDAHFHLGNGDASRAFVNAYARSARDREVELPAGAIRTVDVTEVEGVVVTGPEVFGGRPVGSLRLTFASDHLTAIRSEHHDAWVRASWGVESGDRDRFGELNLGVNPRLTPQAGLPVPYYGYGAGVVRLSLGDNSESAGRWRSSFQQWLFLTDATVRADGRPIVEHGELVIA
jgi:leucyl aminopeptidase (aminopeptidase T)